MNNDRIDIHNFLSEIITTVEKNEEGIGDEKVKSNINDILTKMRKSISDQNRKFRKEVDDRFFRDELDLYYDPFASELNIFNSQKNGVLKLQIGNTILDSLCNLKIPKWLKKLINILKEIVAIVLILLQSQKTRPS